MYPDPCPHDACAVKLIKLLLIMCLSKIRLVQSTETYRFAIKFVRPIDMQKQHYRGLKSEIDPSVRLCA